MIKAVKNFIRLFRDIIHHFFATNSLLHASALAYATLLALVPIAVVSLGVLSAFPVFQKYAHEVNRFLLKHFVASSADTIQDYIEIFASKAASISATGLIFSIITAVMLIFSMETAFNAIWNVKKRRRGVPAFLMYWAVLTLVPLCIGLAISFNVFLKSFPIISSMQGIFDFIEMTHIVPLLLTWISFLLIYKTLANCPVSMRGAAIGAGFGAIFFELMKTIFGIYIVYFSSYAVIYGSIGIIPTFLMWIYISWIIVIGGAVISYKCEHYFTKKH